MVGGRFSKAYSVLESDANTLVCHGRIVSREGRKETIADCECVMYEPILVSLEVLWYASLCGGGSSDGVAYS